jgi:exodeoxyribonuclease V beta subunit
VSDLITGPLPANGIACVEASAGTGKTYLLSTLAARWLVESDDVRVSELLVVTFTVAAAAELRGRIRERLVQVRDRLDGTSEPTQDRYLEGLAALANPERVRARAARALAEFDTATIRTIHAFASAAMGSDRSAVGPAEERRRQAVADVIAARAFDPESAFWNVPEAGFGSVDGILKLTLDHPDLLLAPLEGSADDSPAAIAHRAAVVEAAELFHARQRRDGVVTFADLLTRLDAELATPRSRLLGALRSRYRIGLIDEFQDTDPVQWSIFRRLFLEDGDGTLVVVGDPKQAIYGFRGADVSTYLAAKQEARETPSGGGLGIFDLRENHRSDGVLLEALNAVFDGTHFDESEQIAYHAVKAPAAHELRRAVDADGEPVVPLSIRVCFDEGTAYAKQRAIARDCADEAVHSLTMGVVGVDGVRVPVGESDIAVLCTSRGQFPMLKEAFLRRGIRATEAKSDDVLSSSAALQVDVLLAALSDPERRGSVMALAYSWFGSRDADGPALDVVRGRIAAWQAALARGGVAALGRSVTEQGVLRGLLTLPNGERHLTDLQHLFDLLTAAAPPDAGPATLLELMGELRAEERGFGDEDTRARRIETDAPAVRLMTVHGSKGLEFKVVLCPFIRTGSVGVTGPTVWREPRLGRMIDAAGGAEWTDISLEAPTPESRKALAEEEAAGENRRLVYVALTRARHRCVAWWTPLTSRQNPHRDELTSLLFDRDVSGRSTQRSVGTRKGIACFSLDAESAFERLTSNFADLAERRLLEVAPVGFERGASQAADLRPRPAADRRVEVSVLHRELLQRDGRCSFSSLVADRAHSGIGLDPALGDGGADDEGPGALVAEEELAFDPFDGLAGPAFGTAVHEALELAVTRRRDEAFDTVARESLAAALRARALPVTEQVLDGLVRVASVPVHPGCALRDLERHDVATELRFSLPVASGVGLADIGSVLADGDHDGPFGEWARRTASEAASRQLAETLVGSIDLVTTFSTGSRYFVVDYKTNLCDPATGGYSNQGLATKMQASDYPLQAALYLVALHRYLRWRVADYDPADHLGGASYLFLRGMRSGSPDGICSWPLPGATVSRLSDLLAGLR